MTVVANYENADGFFGIQTAQNSTSAGALTRTPLVSLRRSPRSPRRLGEGISLPFLNLSMPSASLDRRLRRWTSSP